MVIHTKFMAYVMELGIVSNKSYVMRCRLGVSKSQPPNTSMCDIYGRQALDRGIGQTMSYVFQPDIYFSDEKKVKVTEKFYDYVNSSILNCSKSLDQMLLRLSYEEDQPVVLKYQ